MSFLAENDFLKKALSDYNNEWSMETTEWTKMPNEWSRTQESEAILHFNKRAFARREIKHQIRIWFLRYEPTCFVFSFVKVNIWRVSFQFFFSFLFLCCVMLWWYRFSHFASCLFNVRRETHSLTHVKNGEWKNKKLWQRRSHAFPHNIPFWRVAFAPCVWNIGVSVWLCIDISIESQIYILRLCQCFHARINGNISNRAQQTHSDIYESNCSDDRLGPLRLRRRTRTSYGLHSHIHTSHTVWWRINRRRKK